MKPPSQLGTTPSRGPRRRVELAGDPGACGARAAGVKQSPHGLLSELLDAFDEILALDDPDAILKRAVEIAQQRIGLGRVAIFLVDRQRKLMLGTWGSDLRGRLVDEHHIMYEMGPTDHEAFRRSEQDGAHFTVFELSHRRARRRRDDRRGPRLGRVHADPIGARADRDPVQ